MARLAQQQYRLPLEYDDDDDSKHPVFNTDRFIHSSAILLKPSGEKELLKVVPISEPKVQEWIAISYDVRGILENVWRERNDMKIEVYGTCSANSFLHALACQYVDDERIRNFMDERIRTMPDSDLERLIVAFARGGVSEYVYRLRREFLSRTCFVSPGSYLKHFRCFSTDIQNLLQFVSPIFPAVTTTTNCKCQILRKFASLPVEAEYLRKGLMGLQKAIDERNNGDVLCKRCGQKNPENHVFSDIVSVEVGPPIASLQLVFNLMGVPKTIILKGQEYVLTCILDMKSKTHVAVSCRREKGWYQYDDFMKRAQRMGNQSVPSILLYKKAD